MIHYKICSNQNELEEALKLSYNIFKLNSNGLTFEYKNAIWKDYPDFKMADVLLCLDGQVIIGVIRLTPMTFRCQGQEIASYGMSSICLSEKYRGKGLSKDFMNFALDHMKALEIPMAHLIARRNVDHYYNQFGFFGASSYQQIKIKQLNEVKTKTLKSQMGFQMKFIPQYNQLYQTNYNDCFGMVKRTEKYWQYLEHRIKHFSWINYFNENQFVAYTLKSEDKILEFSFNQSLTQTQLDEILFTEAKECQLEIPWEHQLCSKLEAYDTTYSTRQCLYGGHMIKILDDQKVNSFFKKLNSKQIEGTQTYFHIGKPEVNKFFFNLSVLDQT